MQTFTRLHHSAKLNLRTLPEMHAYLLHLLMNSNMFSHLHSFHDHVDQYGTEHMATVRHEFEMMKLITANLVSCPGCHERKTKIKCMVYQVENRAL